MKELIHGIITDQVIETNIMKKLNIFILLLSILSSCTKDDIVDYTNVVGMGKDGNPIIITDDIEEKSFVPQTIFPTSVQNHEWNNGWYTLKDDHINYGGTSRIEFQVGYTFVDYDKDGDIDIFVVPENRIYDLWTREMVWGWTTPIILENKGVKNNKRQWVINDDIVHNGGVSRGYRKMGSADLDNDGDLDIVGFNAEDPYDGNGNRVMGGIDIFYDKGSSYDMEVVSSYDEGPQNFYHGGALGDIDGDGFVDIIGPTTGIRLFFNNGDGKFDLNEYTEVTRFKRGFYDVADVYSIEVFDINQDGLNDLLVGASKKPGNRFYDEVYSKEDWGRPSEIYLNTGTYPYFKDEPDFYLPIEYDYSNEDDTTYIYNTFGIHYDWSIVDFDDDGDYDIFTYTYNERNTKLISYFENQNGQYVSKTEDLFKGNQFFNGDISWIKVMDIDGDGLKEILIEESPRAEFNAWKLNNGIYEQVYLQNIY